MVRIWITDKRSKSQKRDEAELPKAKELLLEATANNKHPADKKEENVFDGTSVSARRVRIGWGRGRNVRAAADHERRHHVQKP